MASVLSGGLRPTARARAPVGVSSCPWTQCEASGVARTRLPGASVMSGSDGKPCRLRGSSRLAVRPGDDVDHHRDEAEVEDPGQHERDEPRLALELPGVQHSADPGDEAGDDTAGCGEGAEEREAQERG